MTRLNYMTLFQAILASFALSTPLQTTTPVEGEVSSAEWAAFNETIHGQLIRSYPSAAVCHDPLYNDNQCSVARTNWSSSDWRTSQPGAYSGILWEIGSDVCAINGSATKLCGQGRVAQYTVNATGVDDIQASVKFAREKCLYLVIKNTGHDHLGRSSGSGSFAIWTHNLKGRSWLTSFVPANAPSETPGIPAVTLQAGEQWVDVYRDAQAHSVTIAGGMARTVGAAGGYLTGGGHSPFAHFYGLAADNLLEATLVAPNSTAVTINEYSGPEYFWALRGGAGSAWGVITSVTYKTHPLPTLINTIAMQFNVSENVTLSESKTIKASLMRTFFKAIPAIADAGYVGYSDAGGNQLSAIFVQANGTNQTFERGFGEALKELMAIKGASGGAIPIEFPTWSDYTSTFLADPNVATNIQDASRLLTADVLVNKTDRLLDLISEFDDLSPGFNFIGSVNPAARNKTSVHPIWAVSKALFSFSGNWPDSATEASKHKVRTRLVELSEAYTKIVGIEAGTYTNEANPYEPYWKEAFWGTENYERLLAVKNRIDPKRLFRCNRCVGGDILLGP